MFSTHFETDVGAAIPEDDEASEARSELDMQELRGQTELFKNQLYSFTLEGWNFTRRINYLIILRERRAGYAPNWTGKKRFLQEDRVQSLQEIEELKTLCCTETVEAKQLRIDELSTQEKESKSTVNQRMVQIQELQDRVSSLHDAREFYEPETASS